jgi:hypothetical protein
MKEQISKTIEAFKRELSRYDISPEIEVVYRGDKVYLFVQYDLPTYDTYEPENNAYVSHREETVYPCVTLEDVQEALELIINELNDAQQNWSNA